MKYLVIISGIVGAALLYLLSSASANTELFSHNYYVLLLMTGVLATGLAGLLASQAWQLRTKLKQKVYGAKLTLRLVTIFSVITILPGMRYRCSFSARALNPGLMCAWKKPWKGD
jgi:nitrogen fixation/metabolism regulation signal transduction histidine kinase